MHTHRLLSYARTAENTICASLLIALLFYTPAVSDSNTTYHLVLQILPTRFTTATYRARVCSSKWFLTPAVIYQGEVDRVTFNLLLGICWAQIRPLSIQEVCSNNPWKLIGFETDVSGLVGSWSGVPSNEKGTSSLSTLFCSHAKIHTFRNLSREVSW